MTTHAQNFQTAGCSIGHDEPGALPLLRGDRCEDVGGLRALVVRGRGARAAQATIELPFAAWPEADRAAWDDLFRPGNVLDGQGAAVHWTPATRRTNRKHYARWLGWLEATGQLDASVEPWRRATPERVEAFARSLIDRVAPGPSPRP